MWAILKTRKMDFSTLKNELKKRLGTDLEFYYPKIKNKYAKKYLFEFFFEKSRSSKNQ